MDRQFCEGTRGRMVTLLRRRGRTVEELAKAVGLTNNGVRAHLATLERDGVVRQGGTVRPASGGGKPAFVHELTAEAGVRARTEEAVAVLNELGGLAELEERDGNLAIRGHGCQLAAVTPEHPGACRKVETLVAELAGVSVRERCERGAKPRCCFEVALAESTAAHE